MALGIFVIHLIIYIYLLYVELKAQQTSFFFYNAFFYKMDQSYLGLFRSSPCDQLMTVFYTHNIF